MSCSWNDHWKCNNPRIAHVGWMCKANARRTVRLQPGEAYERGLTMYVAGQGHSRKESFRMGFTPIGAKETYWSNDVVVALGEDRAEQGAAADRPCD